MSELEFDDQSLESVQDPASLAELDAAEAQPDLSKLTEAMNATNPLGDLLDNLSGSGVAESLSGRAKSARGAATGKYGGSAASETAVEAGIDWLARHQLENGSWCFDHTRIGNCNCGNAGSHKGTTGATGLALLCYFGAGYTYADGDHSAEISRGLRYLMTQMEIKSSGVGDLREDPSDNGGIYQHGIATAALCEALSVTNALMTLRQREGTKVKLIDSEGRELTGRDLVQNQKTIRRACQLAVNYLLSHQSPSTGGWGYKPRSGGDLSVTGWQMYALVSADHAGIEIPPKHLASIVKYLDSVSKSGGTQYSYNGSKNPTPSMNAVGLFGRMLTGWNKNNPTFKEGVRSLSRTGPKPNEMYYSYYATQVLFGYGDDYSEQLWTQWNNGMRDSLVARQARQGHAAGSWPGKSSGGRFFETCLAILTLEIYYRKLPMLQRLAVEPLKLD